MKEDTRAAQARRAEKVLMQLLRTPKTRPGLVAAVASKKISRNFVFGWVAEKTHSGLLVKLKTQEVVTYQLATHFYEERPKDGAFPSWLEPRELPSVQGRRAYIDGKPADQYRKEEKEQDE